MLVVLAISWIHLLAGQILYVIAQQVFGLSQKHHFNRRHTIAGVGAMESNRL